MKKIILENQLGVLIHKGKFVRELQPGQVRYSLFLGQQVQVFDVRPMYTAVSDTYMTRDQLGTTLTVGLTYVVASPITYLRTVNDPYNLIRTTIVDLVRAWALNLTLDELLEKQSELKEKLEKSVPAELKKYGLRLDGVSAPVVALPRGLKQAMEAKIVAAKKAQADMEEARGRTAVLRHYANAADEAVEAPKGRAFGRSRGSATSTNVMYR